MSCLGLGFMAKEDKESVTDRNESVVLDEECYQVPWEFTSSSANLRAKNGEINEQDNSAFAYPGVLAEMKAKHQQRIPPACGLAARKLLAEKANNLKPSRGKNGALPVGSKSQVWMYRGPKDDHRSSSEYDVPWDFLPKTATLLPTDEEEPQGSDVGGPAGPLRKTQKDRNINCWMLRKAKAQSAGNSESPDISLDRSGRWNGKTSASPATSTSSSAGRTSNHSRNSMEFGSNACLKSSSSQGSSDNLKLSATPLLETAFCSTIDMAPTEKKIEVKDRLIQRVCQETDKEYQERLEKQRDLLLKRKCKKPVPTPRRRKDSGGPLPNPPEECQENGNHRESHQTEEEQYDIPWEFCSKGKLNRMIQNKLGEEKPLEPISLDRKLLSLNFGCAGLNPVAESVDKDLPLKEQPWYHGNISRAESEVRLAKCQEGSYLIRNCESNRDEYALSLKSAKGYMHMKIQLNEEEKWILGYFSQPFHCIPSMIRYYSINKLPIKGAEHMCLLHPIIDTLL